MIPADESEIQMVLDRTRTPAPRRRAGARPPARVEPFKPFPIAALPQPLRAFVESGAQAVRCEPSYLALPVLAALASAVGNSRCLLLKRGWSVPAIIWSAIVGESGSAKAPAFDLVMQPFRDRQAHSLKQQAEARDRTAADYDRALEAWIAGKSREFLPPARPQRSRVERSMVVDLTPGALGPLLSANPRGFLLARDDLAGWVTAFERSVAGKGKLDSSYWCSMHKGRSLLIDKQGGTARNIFVERAAVSVAGALRPSTLKRAIACGLAARLLVSWPSRPRQPKCWTARELDPAAEADFARLIERLYALQPDTDADGQTTPGLLRLDPQAQAAWQTWYNAHALEQAALTGEFLAASSKLEEYAARLALVIHCVRAAADDPQLNDPGAVDLASTSAGVTLANWFKAEARRVYALVCESDVDRARRQLIEWIDRKGGSATARDVQRGHRQYATADEAEAALEDLAEILAGRWESSPTDRRGHPTRRFWLFECESTMGVWVKAGTPAPTTPPTQSE